MNEQLQSKLSEFEEYVRNSKANTQFFLEKLNQSVKYEFDKDLCDCKELKAENFPAEYKWIYCIVTKQISSKPIFWPLGVKEDFKAQLKEQEGMGIAEV